MIHDLSQILTRAQDNGTVYRLIREVLGALPPDAQLDGRGGLPGLLLDVAPPLNVPTDLDLSRSVGELVGTMDVGDHFASIASSCRNNLSLYDAHLDWALGIADLERDQGGDAIYRLHGIGLAAHSLFEGSAPEQVGELLSYESGRALVCWFVSVDFVLAFSTEDEPADLQRLKDLIDLHKDAAMRSLFSIAGPRALEGSEAVVGILLGVLKSVIVCASGEAETISGAVRRALPELDDNSREALQLEADQLAVYRLLLARLCAEMVATEPEEVEDGPVQADAVQAPAGVADLQPEADPVQDLTPLLDERRAHFAEVRSARDALHAELDGLNAACALNGEGLQACGSEREAAVAKRTDLLDRLALLNSDGRHQVHQERLAAGETAFKDARKEAQGQQKAVDQQVRAVDKVRLRSEMTGIKAGLAALRAQHADVRVKRSRFIVENTRATREELYGEGPGIPEQRLVLGEERARVVSLLSKVQRKRATRHSASQSAGQERLTAGLAVEAANESLSEVRTQLEVALSHCSKQQEQLDSVRTVFAESSAKMERHSLSKVAAAAEVEEHEETVTCAREALTEATAKLLALSAAEKEARVKLTADLTAQLKSAEERKKRCTSERAGAADKLQGYEDAVSAMREVRDQHASARTEFRAHVAQKAERKDEVQAGRKKANEAVEAYSSSTAQLQQAMELATASQDEVVLLVQSCAQDLGLIRQTMDALVAAQSAARAEQAELDEQIASIQDAMLQTKTALSANERAMIALGEAQALARQKAIASLKQRLQVLCEQREDVRIRRLVAQQQMDALVGEHAAFPDRRKEHRQARRGVELKIAKLRKQQASHVKAESTRKQGLRTARRAVVIYEERARKSITAAVNAAAEPSRLSAGLQPRREAVATGLKTLGDADQRKTQTVEAVAEVRTRLQKTRTALEALVASDPTPPPPLVPGPRSKVEELLAEMQPTRSARTTTRPVKPSAKTEVFEQGMVSSVLSAMPTVNPAVTEVPDPSVAEDAAATAMMSKEDLERHMAAEENEAATSMMALDDLQARTTMVLDEIDECATIMMDRDALRAKAEQEEDEDTPTTAIPRKSKKRDD